MRRGDGLSGSLLCGHQPVGLVSHLEDGGREVARVLGADSPVPIDVDVDSGLVAVGFVDRAVDVLRRARSNHGGAPADVVLWSPDQAPGTRCLSVDPVVGAETGRDWSGWNGVRAHLAARLSRLARRPARGPVRW